MSGSKTAYLESALLNFILNGTAFTPATTLYAALSTAAFDNSATGSSMTEVSGPAYARVAIVCNTSNWPTSVGAEPAVITNANSIGFPTASGSWGTVLSIYLVDASSGGNTYYGADLAAAVDINTGSSLAIPPNAAVFQET